MARPWHRHFTTWPRWLRAWHIANGALAAFVGVRLFLRGLEFDTWTHLWIVYACSYGLFLQWWVEPDSKIESRERPGAWFF